MRRANRKETRRINRVNVRQIRHAYRGLARRGAFPNRARVPSRKVFEVYAAHPFDAAEEEQEAMENEELAANDTMQKLKNVS